MERRDFLGAGTLAAAGALGGLTAGSAQAQSSGRQYFELREYTVLARSRTRALHQYLEDGLIPSLNRMGINPVGVFSPMYGSDSTTIHVLIPHNSVESALTLHAQLLDDSAFTKAAAPFLDASSDNAGYVRIKSSLMLAFSGMPKVEAPAKGPRIFEMRRYESHNIKAGKLKVEMFNAGEIPIFRKTGLTPVFFGETLIGDRMPNLIYMLTFKDMAERDTNWDVFRNDPDWKRMAGMAKYKDTVSNISDTIMRPAGYSQI